MDQSAKPNDTQYELRTDHHGNKISNSFILCGGMPHYNYTQQNALCGLLNVPI